MIYQLQALCFAVHIYLHMRNKQLKAIAIYDLIRWWYFGSDNEGDEGVNGKSCPSLLSRHCLHNFFYSITDKVNSSNLC